MTELEKCEAGEVYDFWDEDIFNRNVVALDGCAHLNAIDPRDWEKRERPSGTCLGRLVMTRAFPRAFPATTGKTSMQAKSFWLM